MKLLLPVAALFILTACGGSSGDAGSPNTQINVKVPLKITAMQTTTCGGTLPATQAELFIYDDNWNITGRYKAGADGSFLLNTTQKLINFSVVNNLGDHVTPKIAQRVYAQVEPGDYGTLYIGESAETCDCIEAKADIAALSSSKMRNMWLYNDRMDAIPAAILGSTASFNVCRQQDKDWPALTISAYDMDGNVIFGSLTNYQPFQRMLINMDKESQVLPYTTNNTAAKIVSYHYANDGGYNGTAPKRNAPVFIRGVNNLRFISHVASQQKSLPDDRMYIELYTNHSLVQKTGDARALNFVVPAWVTAEAFMANANKDWVHYDKGIQYDYSTFSEFNVITVRLVVGLSGTGYLSQTFTGPLKGQFPASFLPVNYLNTANVDSARLKLISMELRNMSTASNLTSYVKQTLKMHVPFVGKMEREGDTTLVGFQMQEYSTQKAQ